MITAPKECPKCGQDDQGWTRPIWREETDDLLWSCLFCGYKTSTDTNEKLIAMALGNKV